MGYGVCKKINIIIIEQGGEEISSELSRALDLH